ncbi:MAG: ISNCY family transposase [Candidatus Acidiferrales bacterium]|jgi:IS5 family transposase
MVELRHHQRRVWEGWFPEEAEEWWEQWMKQADQVLDDEALLETVHQAQGRRRPNSRLRGRKQTPAEVTLRLAVLKHMRNWSFEQTEREVRANVVYRQFTRIGAEKVPDAKTIARLVQTLGAEVLKQIHQRLVEVAREKKVVRGRKLRVDTTAVETNIHYPTDSSLLGDSARVLTRTMKKITEVTGKAGTRLRDRMRTIRLRVMEIARTSRSQGPQLERKMKQGYRKLLTATRKVVNQAKRFQEEIVRGVKHVRDGQQKVKLRVLREDLEKMLPRVKQVIRQTKARVLGGDVHVPGKLVSVFEPSTEVIRRGKASKPNEFGKMVKIQEAENQIVTDYEVFEKRPSDSDLLVPAVEKHQVQFGRVPRLVAGDAAFYSASNERELEEMGVKQISVPNRSTKSAERRRHQKKRSFRKGQKWRTGSEGRISVLKRRHGLNRCRYRGDVGMQRWVGLAVIADNLINIGRFLAANNTG